MTRPHVAAPGAAPSNRSVGLDPVVRRADRFELGALLRVLLARGFDWNTLRFEGVRSLEPRRGPLVRGLRLEGRAPRLAVISLNAGLLCPGAPLPEYFTAFARRLHDPSDFLQFIDFWDGVLLYDLAYSAHPALSVDASRSLPRAHFARLGTHSPMWIHWIFRSMFPELGVRVRRRIFHSRLGSGQARVGEHLDGRRVLGEAFEQCHEGYEVGLLAESERCEGVDDWESEAQRRLSILERTLRRAGCLLEVVIQFESYRHGHSLNGPAEARRQLGVRPWLRPEPGELYGPGQVVLRPFAQR